MTEEEQQQIADRMTAILAYLSSLNGMSSISPQYHDLFSELVAFAKKSNPKMFGFMSATQYREEYPKESMWDRLAPSIFTGKYLEKNFFGWSIKKPLRVLKWTPENIQRFIYGKEGEGGGFADAIYGDVLTALQDPVNGPVAMERLYELDTIFIPVIPYVDAGGRKVETGSVFSTGEEKTAVTTIKEDETAGLFYEWAQAAMDGVPRGGENSLRTTTPESEADFKAGSEYVAAYRELGITDDYEIITRLYYWWANEGEIQETEEEFVRRSKLDAKIIARALKENPRVDVGSLVGLNHPLAMDTIWDLPELFRSSDVLQGKTAAEARGVVLSNVIEYLASNIGGSFVEDLETVGEEREYVIEVINSITDEVYRTVYDIWTMDTSVDETDILEGLGTGLIASLYTDIAFAQEEEDSKVNTLTKFRELLKRLYPGDFSSEKYGNITADSFIITAGGTGFSPLEALRRAYPEVKTYADLEKLLDDEPAVVEIVDILMDEYRADKRARMKAVDVDALQEKLWRYMEETSKTFRDLPVNEQTGYIQAFSSVMTTRYSDETFIERTMDELIVENVASFNGMLIDEEPEKAWGDDFASVVDRAWDIYRSMLPTRNHAIAFLYENKGRLQAHAEGLGYENVYDLLWSKDGLSTLEFILPEEVETEQQKKLNAVVGIAERLMQLQPEKYKTMESAAADAYTSYDLFSVEAEVGGFDTLEEYLDSSQFLVERTRILQEEAGSGVIGVRLEAYKRRSLHTELAKMWRLSPIEASSDEMQQFMDDYIDMALDVTGTTIDDFSSTPELLHNIQVDSLTQVAIDEFISDVRQEYSDFERSFGARMEGIPQYQWGTAIDAYYKSKQDFHIAVDREMFEGNYFDYLNSTNRDVQVYKSIFAATIAETKVLDRARRELDVLMGRGVESITINEQLYDIVDLRERLGAVGQPTDSITEETLNVVQEWATKPSSETLMSRVQLFAEKEEGKLFGELANVYSGVAGAAAGDYQQVLRNWGFFSDETSKLGPYFQELWSEYATIYNPTNATITAPLLGVKNRLLVLRFHREQHKGLRHLGHMLKKRERGSLRVCCPMRGRLGCGKRQRCKEIVWL